MTRSQESVVIAPAGPIAWRGTVPGSKSLSARALITAALAEGRSRLPGLLRCEDTEHLARALAGCGMDVALTDQGAEVGGRGGEFPVRRGAFFVGNAGTAMRFLTAALTVAEGRYTIDGTARMRARPIGELTAALTALGADVRDTRGFPPVAIGPARLRGGAVAIAGDRSSQFASGLLMAAPYGASALELR